MKRYVFTIWWVVMFLFYACETDESPRTIPPEMVIKKYQEFIDKNRFDAAKNLSTERGKELIEEMEASIPEDLMEYTLLVTKFYEIDCEIEEVSAVCICDLEDDYERYEALYNLVKVDGRWLVDAPEEDMEFEEINEMIDEIIKRGLTN